MMTKEELQMLRKKQIRNNYMIIIPLMILFSIVVFFASSPKVFYLLLWIMVILVFMIEGYRYFTGKVAFSKDMKRLAEYEKGKMGEKQFYKERKTALLTQGLMVIVIGMQMLLAQDEEPFFTDGAFRWTMVAILVIFIPAIHVSVKARAKRIDEWDQEKLKDYQKNNIKRGIAAFFITFFGMLIVAWVVIANL
ncbi:hypothetical protein [Pontibacillus salipaludis]|uniref:hypothetical protein n=1 Tax=Pontibacillus salipaludis TaxID=1697394 RepID=UPI0031E60A8C